MSAAPVVELDAATRRFGAVTAVDDVSLTVRHGEFFSLLGPSGCGKTTTLRLIAGLEQPDRGTVRIDGASVNGSRPYERPVSMVFQNYALFPHLSVERNVAFGLEQRRVPRDRIAARVREALTMVRLDPATFGARRPAELSGGQRQRVALARALVLKPRVLLLDEPLGALDLKLRRAMQTELRALNRALGITFIYVTHDQDEALALSDRIAVMHEARVAQVGTPAEIYEHPRTRFVAGFVGSCNFVTAPDGRLSAIRPERIRLTAAADAEPGAHRATVRERTYLGESMRVTVALADGAELLVTVANRGAMDGAWQPGEVVAVAWTPADVHPLDDR